ncbi:MAG TPA: aldo/keto reductase [Longimicrobiales bacterium]|nr:aldo/keto reductase [Longimicrobiales bacterium]
MTEAEKADPEMTPETPVEAHGAAIPVLGFGTWQLTDGAARDMVEVALDLGYRHVDTAQAYENEDEVGRAIEASNVAREDVFLTTKIWPDDFGEDRFLDSVQESLDRLRVDAVDLLLLHWPVFERATLEETVSRLNRARDAGLARHIGLSNFTVDLTRRAWKATEFPLAVNQIEYHPYLDQAPLLGELRERDMAITAYSPIARGDVDDDPVIREVAGNHGKSPEQVALRWLVQQDRVNAIPKTSDEDHARENLRIFDFELSPEEMERLDGLSRPDGRHVNPEFAPDWD